MATSPNLSTMRRTSRGPVRHIIDVDGAGFGLLPGADAAPSQRPVATILG